MWTVPCCPCGLSAVAAMLTLVMAASLAWFAFKAPQALVRRLDLVEGLTRREADRARGPRRSAWWPGR